MVYSVKFIKELDKLEPDLKAVLLELLAEIERNREESITRREFLEFGQKTEENFQRVWKVIEELSQAQKRTEQRVDTLALRVEELAEAQKRTEQRVEELAHAQKRTEEALRKLTLRVDDLAEQVGGLSNTVGYGLEDQSYPRLKKILNRDFNIQVDRLYRKNIMYSENKFDEINIYGEARKNGKKVYIIGECKAQFGPKDVTRLLKLIDRVKSQLTGDIFPLALAYHFHPQAEKKLADENIKHFWSFEIQEY
jgi:chromosome segregation ATPase